ncbi:MAG: class I SAM-dependent methyltransferase [Spirochaetes bacterium]|nr:class I SAM-dependent methyltransferase [Spirochaetota bacterium]
MFRKGNHWKKRIDIVFDIVNKLELFGNNVLDLGTSIGTYAVEFAERGFKVDAIDFDKKAIKMAQEIAKKKNIKINYKVGNISHKNNYKAKTFDIIYAGDIIEHLLPAELNSTIFNCYNWLKDGGYFLYHTVPTKYDVIFHKSFMWVLLIPVFFLPERFFKYCVKMTYILYNILFIFKKGMTFNRFSKKGIHCNLQTKGNFLSILNKNKFHSMYNILCTTKNRFKKGLQYILFKNKEYYKKDMFGIAWKSLPEK